MVRRAGWLRRAVKVAAAATDLVRRPRGLVVLIYHRVGGGSGSEVDLDPDLFAVQMAELAHSGRVVSLDEGLAAVCGAKPDGPAADPIVLTVDDGTADFADVAFPILERHRLPSCVYLATSFVDEGRAFPWGAPPLSWAAVADLASTGLVTIGSHTHRHLLLDRLPVAEVAGELDRSIDLIATHTGTPPAHFAYPKAVAPSDAAAAAVATRFRSAALAGCRPNPYGRTDPHRLARSPIQASDGLRWFRRKVAGGMRAEDDLRRVLNRRRYAGSVT